MEEKFSGVWIYVEYRRGVITRPTLELLSIGRKLANKLGVSLSAILIGYGVGEVANTLIRYGADRVYVADDETLMYYNTLLYVGILADLVSRERPEIILFPATSTGRDLAPRLAARLETGLTADCTGLDIGDYTDPFTRRSYRNILYQMRPAFGGDVIATIVTPDRRPQMATVRPGVFEPPIANPGREGEVVEVKVEFTQEKSVVEILEEVIGEQESHLEDARIIVAGGRGVGGLEGFRLIGELAKALGGQVGASRAAVDAGWISHDHQIGLTGRTVRPDIYIACGISGAIQHIIGVRNAKTIIAINRDPDAPIFNYADYGVVGDLFEILPLLIQKVRLARRGKNDSSIQTENTN